MELNERTTEAVNALMIAIVEMAPKNTPFMGGDFRVSLMQGKKYLRLVVSYGDGQHHRSVWGFINVENGDILKAASWASPAKHARGNIFRPDEYMKTIRYTGPAYL